MDLIYSEQIEQFSFETFASNKFYTEVNRSLVQNADAVFFCNAIHLISNKLSAFKFIASILTPHGIFACNSAFYNGAYVEGTERFYRQWTRRAIGWLHREHPEVHLSREAKAMAMQQLDREGYIYLLRA